MCPRLDSLKRFVDQTPKLGIDGIKTSGLELSPHHRNEVSFRINPEVGCGRAGPKVAAVIVGLRRFVLLDYAGKT